MWFDILIVILVYDIIKYIFKVVFCVILQYIFINNGV